MTSAQHGARAKAGSAAESTEDHCPDKPREESGFDPPVAWLFGCQLISGLNWIALYAAFGEKLDAKDRMRPRLIAMDDPQIDGSKLKPRIVELARSAMPTSFQQPTVRLPPHSCITCS